MPAWLVTALVQLLTPIVEKVIEKLLIAARLNAIEKRHEKIGEGLDRMAKAETPEEIRSAVRAISSAWNK